ncbi:hypothetical protein Bbelb_051170 [Branchiostoma belcheri]|nr:hypothetical protein Bbelb_051170 [Branchiostoma belcheri]
MSAIWVLSENLQLEEDGTEVVTTDRYILDVKTELKHVVEFDKLAPQDRSGNVLRELFLAEKVMASRPVRLISGPVQSIICPMTLLGYHQTFYKHTRDAGFIDFHTRLTYNKFRLTWYSFLNILNINYDSGVQCPECGPEPKLVICDGTALSFRRELRPWDHMLQQDAKDGEVQNSGR